MSDTQYTNMTEHDAALLNDLFARYGGGEVLHTLAVVLECCRRAFADDADYQAQITHDVAVLAHAQAELARNYRSAK